MEEDVGEAAQQRNDEFPPGMAPKMLSLLKAVTTLQDRLQPLLAQPHHQAFRTLSPLERAKAGMMEVYTINSLFWMLMKSSGEEVDDTLRDDYKMEMGRLKDAQGRLTEVEVRARRPQMDTRVAARLIQRGLGVNTKEKEGREEDMEEEAS